MCFTVAVGCFGFMYRKRSKGFLEVASRFVPTSYLSELAWGRLASTTPGLPLRRLARTWHARILLWSQFRREPLHHRVVSPSSLSFQQPLSPLVRISLNQKLTRRR